MWGLDAGGTGLTDPSGFNPLLGGFAVALWVQHSPSSV